MKTFLTLALAAALCAPVTAQKMGSSNGNAPTIKQSIAAGEATISLDYISITWASGKTMDSIMDKEKGANTRTRINNNASKAPLATFKTSVDVKCGDLNLAAGEYKIFYTIDDDLNWNINFMMGEKTQTMKLELADSEHESKRLLMCLYAGEEAGAGVYISFGNKSGMLEFKPSTGAKTEKGDKK